MCHASCDDPGSIWINELPYTSPPGYIWLLAIFRQKLIKGKVITDGLIITRIYSLPLVHRPKGVLLVLVMEVVMLLWHLHQENGKVSPCSARSAYPLLSLVIQACKFACGCWASFYETT